MKGIIDRFEADKVVVEMKNHEMKVYDRNKFPQAIKEGDIVIFKDNRFVVDVTETEKRSKFINNLFEDLIDDEAD